MTEEPVTIVDREVLKVLSVDTRMDILKLLSGAEGGRTPSFVAKKLGKSDATIVEHLQTLSEAGLVKKTMSPGKKWVFYSLTERGVGIVSSKSRRLVIILATSLVALIFGLGGFANYFYASGIFTAIFTSILTLPSMLTSPAMQASERTLGGAEAPLSTPLVPSAGEMQMQVIILYASIVLIVSAVAGLGFYFYKKSKFEKFERTKWLEGAV